MSSCEKCWADAYKRAITNPSKPQHQHYVELVMERQSNPCTPKEQAGRFWNEEKQCDIRSEKVKAICPLCGWVSNVPRKLIGNQYGINDVKCSPCFKERNTFVNLELTNFEKEQALKDK